MDSGPFLDLAVAIMDEANAAGSMVIVNDRADIAVLAKAHGLHVGQDDLSASAARRVIGTSAVLGLSTHNQAQWEAALREPISYLAIGPVFTTETKATGVAAVGLATVRRASDAAAGVGLPVVAIGGITLDRAPEVIASGAASVAVIGDLLTSLPELRARAFLRALA